MKGRRPWKKINLEDLLEPCNEVSIVSFVAIRKLGESVEFSGDPDCDIFLITEKGKKRFEENDIEQFFFKTQGIHNMEEFFSPEFSGDIYYTKDSQLAVLRLEELFRKEMDKGAPSTSRNKEIITPTHYIMIIEWYSISTILNTPLQQHHLIICTTPIYYCWQN